MDTRDCPTCNGYVLTEKGFVKSRRTVGLVCPDCGHDYGADDEQDS